MHVCARAHTHTSQKTISYINAVREYGLDSSGFIFHHFPDIHLVQLYRIALTCITSNLLFYLISYPGSNLFVWRWAIVI